MQDFFTHQITLGPGGVLDPKELPAHGGVFLIVDGEDRPILLAAGESLRRIIKGRLAEPLSTQPTKRVNLAEIVQRIYWTESFSRFETAMLHWRAARLLYPKSHRKLLSFGPAWFVRLELQKWPPGWSVVREFPSDADYCYGPIGDRTKAHGWMGLLGDVWGLCRYPYILEQAPQGQACAYHEMGKCPAPCNGSISMDEYRRMLEASADFTAGHQECRLKQLRESMQEASAQLAYEKAASLRQVIEQVRGMSHDSELGHLTHITQCCWLIVQRGGPVRRSPKTMLVKPFFVRMGAIEVGAPVTMEALETVLPQWLALCKPCSVLPAKSRGEQIARCELLWLVSKFLFQEDRAPGLFLRFDRLPEATRLAELIRERCCDRDSDQRPEWQHKKPSTTN